MTWSSRHRPMPSRSVEASECARNYSGRRSIRKSWSRSFVNIFERDVHVVNHLFHSQAVSGTYWDDPAECNPEWLQLSPRCEVILCGNDPGVAEAAAEYGVKHLPHIARNEYGTPFLNSAFEHVQQVAKERLIAYVNADIIFLSALMASVKRITAQRFLMVGQRWDLDVSAPLDFKNEDWEQILRRQVSSCGTLHPPAGSDYFIFPKGVMGEIPPFCVGRPGWDNWFIYRARSLGVPVIDATGANMVIHQNHDYSHLQEDATVSNGGNSDAYYNLKLLGDQEPMFTLYDATHLLTRHMLAPAWTLSHFERRWKMLPVWVPWTGPLVRYLDWLVRKVADRL